MADNEQAGSPELDSSPSLADRIADQFLGPEAPVEQDTAPDSPGPDEAVDAEAAASDEGVEPEATAPDVEEVEWQGEKFQVPAKLKEAVIQASDYTKKTQELAEQRRLVEFEQKKVSTAEAERKFAESVRDEINTLAQIDQTLAQYRNVDISSLSDREIAMMQYTVGQLKERKEDTQRALDNKHRQFQTQQQKALEDLMKEGREIIRKNIPNFNETVANDIAKQLRSEGYSDEQIASSMDPIVFKLAWKAAQFDKLQSAKSQTAQKIAQAKPIGKTAPSARPMDQAARERIAFTKAKNSAKTSTERAAVIAKYLESRF